MILSHLKLENFKQFRDPVELEPPEGAIGVVGPNGSGKTTLFEAILWSFFGTKAGGPRFGNDSIPWSGGSTAERSLVEVTLDVGGASYTVSRSLHRGKATAYIYDEGGSQVTSGPNDVSNWVQEKLLEMDRIAFDATFFARQKELAFFAGVEGVKRQREVARILGIDQVEGAQNLLRADRNVLRAQTSHIEQTLDEVDFDSLEGELTESRKLRDSLKERVEEATKNLDARNASLEKARSEYARQEKLYREYNELSSRLGGATSARDRATERVTDFESRLRRMDEDEKSIADLEPKVKGLSEIEAEIEVLEESRRRAERLETAKRELVRVSRQAYDAANEAADLLEELPGEEALISGWSEIFDEPDDLEQARIAAELLEDAGPTLERATSRLGSLQKIIDLYERLSELDGKLEQAAAQIRESQESLEDLEEEMKSLTGELSLDERLNALRDDRSALQSESAQRMGEARATEAEIEKLAKARELIEASDEHATCPTCQRGFEDDEHTEVIASIRRQEDQLSRNASDARAEARRLDEDSDGISREISALEQSRNKIRKLENQSTAAATKRDYHRNQRDDLRAEAERLRKELDGASRPTDEEMEVAERDVQTLRELRDARPKLLGLLASSDRLRANAAERQGDVDRLSGGEPYDAERHGDLNKRRSEIQTTVGRIETLKASLEARPEVEEKLKSERETKESSVALVTRLEASLRELGFSDEAHEGSRVAVSESERARDEAREEKGSAENELREIESTISGTEKELARYADQRRIADEKSVEVSSLGDMDRLLTEFYRELTARVRPKLQREASDLVRTLTDGRYTQMEFDENYGVRLYDGLSDAYEISRFSGGEADIASLCARVALSKMISGKGAGALGFIVLDEVFGALDADRRRNVLFALERLKATFGQIFMISHVTDVQESSLLDETWFIEEDEEGKSSVRRVKHTLSSGELEVSAHSNLT